jgi:hypothetical protein
MRSRARILPVCHMVDNSSLSLPNIYSYYVLKSSDWLVLPDPFKRVSHREAIIMNVVFDQVSK